MPVVRELINRISIQLNKGSKKNADNAFDDISKRGVKSANTIKKAFAAIGVGLSVKEVVKSITDLEQQTASAKFFSRSADEAGKLLDLLSKTAERSELISEREGRRAAATLSSINASIGTLEGFIPFLEKISIARPGMDFDVVAQTLREVIKSGDIQALQELIPGIKSDLELLSKSKFGSPFGEVLEQQRAELVLETLVKNRERLNELAKEQENTLSITAQKLEETGSDFITNFGKKTAPAIKGLLSEINKTLDLLNNSEGFWKTIESAMGSMSNVLRAARGEKIDEGDSVFSKILGAASDFFAGGERKEGLKQRMIEESAAGIPTIGINRSPTRLGLGKYFKNEQGNVFSDYNPSIADPLINLFKNLSGKQEVSGEVRVVIEGRNVNGMDVKKMEQIANQVVNDRVITPIQNIRARNGDVVPNSP